MLTGLDILLDRMKTNPEEFLREDGYAPYEGEMFGGKWSDLLDYAWRVADKDERDALEAARKEFYRDDFNERVMKRLAGEEVKEEVSPYIVKSTASNVSSHWTDPRAAMQNAVLQGNGYGQAQIKGEGQMVGFGADTYLSGGGDKGFFGLGKLFGK